MLGTEPIFKGYYRVTRKRILEHRLDPTSHLRRVTGDASIAMNETMGGMHDRIPV
jgi:hypothetical protein